MDIFSLDLIVSIVLILSLLPGIYSGYKRVGNIFLNGVKEFIIKKSIPRARVRARTPAHARNISGIFGVSQSC